MVKTKIFCNRSENDKDEKLMILFIFGQFDHHLQQKGQNIEMVRYCHLNLELTIN